MKYLLGCVCSAIAGGMLAVAVCEHKSGGAAIAADAPKSGPALPEPAGTRPRAAAAGDPAPLAADELTDDERVNIAVYDRVNRGVVNITTRGERREGFFLMEVPTEGAGSGSVLDKSGHVLTNNHVIEGARQVTVTLFDGKSYDARFVGSDPINDVAVLKIDAPAESLHPVALGDSRKLKVGMRVFAIGNPFGLERTLTTGIISSLNRALQIHENRTIKSIIQIDAAINPGNSGGPLLDSRARLIGMNTAIATKTGQSAGVGFAIPVGLIARIVPQLLEKGRVIRPEIGIAKVFETEHGLVIYQLVRGGPAERAGLKGPQFSVRRRGPFEFTAVDRSAADVIVAVDGHKVTTADDFLGIIEAKEPGQRVEVTVLRKGQEVHVPVTLGGE